MFYNIKKLLLSLLFLLKCLVLLSVYDKSIVAVASSVAAVRPARHVRGAGEGVAALPGRWLRKIAPFLARIERFPRKKIQAFLVNGTLFKVNKFPFVRDFCYFCESTLLIYTVI